MDIIQSLKKLAVVLVVLTGIFYSCEKEEKPWTINSKIEIAEVPEAYLYKVNEDRSDTLIDSTSVTNHAFTFEGINNSDKLSVYRIKFAKGHGNGLTVLINNGDNINIEILGEYKNIYSGNDIQSEYAKYLKVKQKEVDLMKELVTRMSTSTPDKAEANTKWYTSETKKLNQDKADVISKIKSPELNAYLALDEILTSSIADKEKFELLANSITDEGKATADGNKALEILKYFDAYDLLFQSIQMDYETLKNKYEELNSDNKNSKFGKQVSDRIATLESLDYGKVAPPINAKTIDGKSFDLAQVKAKFILIDFWASWCGPCREENKNYVNLYKQFHDKSFEIVGYSLDTDAKKWKEAVTKDDLSWINISNLKKQKDDSILKSFQIEAVPSNIILKDGKIVARNLFSYELEDFLNQNLY